MDTSIKILFSTTLVLALLLGRCSGNANQVNESINKVQMVVEKQSESKEATVLIDTILEKTGKIQVIYEPVSDRLLVKSWSDKDTVIGSTDWIFLRDSVIMPITPVTDIGYIEDNHLIWTNIICTKNGTLFFAIFDQMHRPNVYAANVVGGKWDFICTETGTCPIWFTTAGCKILDEKRNRLLVKWPELAYDQKEDKDYEYFDVIQYGIGSQHSLGNLKLRQWKEDQCDASSIMSWYNAYLKIANRKKFDMYLEFPK